MRRSVLLLAACAALALAASATAQDCTGDSTGLVPLNDLMEGAYRGAVGGLYPGGVNHRPPGHDAGGLAQASHVVPRDALGAPAPFSGKIVLLSIGFSNATQEFSAFQELVAGDPTVSPRLVLVDGAKGGQTAAKISDPSDPYWASVELELAKAGVTGAQVQAVWLKTANAHPTEPFPAHALVLSSQLRSIAQIARSRWPNARLCYVSSRSYAGYATTSLNPEPFAYESGFAVKWLIAGQILGDPGLSYDPPAGPAQAPWLGWGPYLWADGIVPRSDGLVWECGDFLPDGQHPGPAARLKVAQALDSFFRTDATAREWYLAGPQGHCAPQARVNKLGPELAGATQPKLVASALPTVPAVDPLRLHAFDALPFALGGFVQGAEPIPGGAPFLGGTLLVDPLAVSLAIADEHGKASLVLGALPPNPSLCGATLFAQYASLDLGAPQGFALTRALRLRAGH